MIHFNKYRKLINFNRFLKQKERTGRFYFFIPRSHRSQAVHLSMKTSESPDDDHVTSHDSGNESKVKRDLT